MKAVQKPSSLDGDIQFTRITYESPGMVRKRGDAFRIRREIEAMHHVKLHTSVPIPAILDTHIDSDEDDERSWILMEQLPGRQLGEVWHTMDTTSQEQSICQLKAYFEQLHSLLPPDPGWIGSCSGGPAYDHRLNNISTCGPFASVSEFHDFLVAPARKSPRPEWIAKYRQHLSDSHQIVYAHADLSWENILVDPKTGNVTGILDWEMAGFWPKWWEYRKALFGSRSQLWWIDILKKFVQENTSETETDMELEMF
jgi:aminoglycoside phosphotransferase (APT) family kinase protein